MGPRARSFLPAAALLLASAPLACDVAEDAGAASDVDEPVTARQGWSKKDDPGLLGDGFNYEFHELRTSGYADRMPWPGYYWPAFRDSINYRWDGPDSRSPAAKYGLAFGKSDIEDRVSQEFGADSLEGKSCSRSSDCPNFKGSVCARRRGEKYGVCAEEWFGICHAWAPASILEKEPKHGVNYGGVRFEIQDIKALVSLAYTEGLDVRRVSLRCNEQGGAHAEEQACKDTNPGTFHVAVANLLGERGQAFIHDRTYDYEVWNLPVIGYRVVRNDEVSASTANDMLGTGGGDYKFNDEAVELRRIRLRLDWLSASTADANGVFAGDDWFVMTDTYDYILEIDDVGRIIGGEWVGGSRKRHPDFLWLPIEKHGTTVAGIAYSDVEKLLQLAQ
jgi:hypothetical protein